MVLPLHVCYLRPPRASGVDAQVKFPLFSGSEYITDNFVTGFMS